MFLEALSASGARDLADQHRADAQEIKALREELAMAKLTIDRQRASIRAEVDRANGWRKNYRDVRVQLADVRAELERTAALVEQIQAAQH